MTQYQVDSDAVIGGASAIHGTIERIQTEVIGLRGQLNALQDSWGGQASLAFQRVIAEWHGTQLRVEDGLAAIDQALSTAGQQYAEVEMSNARLFAV
jgi:early secretory antigenic target protein ESAT-6